MKRFFWILMLALVVLPSMAQNKESMLEALTSAMSQGKIPQAKEICDSLLEEKYKDQLTFEEHGTVLLLQATCHTHMGHEDLALESLKKAEDMVSEGALGMTIPSAQWYYAVSAIYQKIDRNKSLSLLLKCIDIYEELEIEDSIYASALLMLGLAYERQTTDMTALVKRMLPKVFAVVERTSGKQSMDYANALLLAVENAKDRKSHDEAISYLNQGIALGQDIYDADSRFRFMLYGKRAIEHAAAGHANQAFADARKYSADLKDHFFANYKAYDTKEVSSNFGYIHSWFCDDIIRVAATINNPELNQIAYDGVLFAKGLFLNTELSSLKKTGIENLKDGSWKRVQASLKKNEAAVEFISYVQSNWFTSYHHNYALVIRPGINAPQLVPLAVVNGIQDDAGQITLAQKCERYWEPLQQELQGVQTVYFSPHGEIHRLPIEHFIPQAMGINKAYRLTSTRELTKKAKRRTITSPVVMGGLVYQMSQEDWDNAGESLAERNKELLAKRSMPDLQAIRDQRAGSTLSYLPGTKREADAIVDLLRQQKYDPLYLSGIQGTEDAFKLLDGQGISLLHIGTHGYYYSLNDNPYLGDAIDDLINSGRSTVMREQAALTLSGLFLSGAEDALSGMGQPEGFDDGILTALDIAHMDFSDLDLVVLSACQTGLGSVSFEGVSGLQRGFKIAGANSIIMSMWNVSDKATDVLMRQFYADYVSGKSKIDAFNNAVQKVKEKFPNPEDWAPFVLLDGVR